MASDTDEIALTPRAAGSIVPLLPWQLWIWKQLTVRGQAQSVRMQAASLRLLGPLSEDRLRESLFAIVRRHESLRTRIICVDGAPRQHVDDASYDPLELVTIAPETPSAIQSEAAQAAQEFATEIISLDVGPLFAARLLRLSKTDHVLLLGLDHMVGDAVSCRLLTREIFSGYYHLEQGRSAPAKINTIQFADYAVWKMTSLQKSAGRTEAYWRTHVAGVPRLRFPNVSDIVEEPCFASHLQHFPFGKSLSRDLRLLTEREHAMLPLVTLAIFSAAMARWCQQREFIIFVNTHGRTRPELKEMIGFISGGLFLRIYVGAADTLRDLVNRVHLEFLSAQDHHGMDVVEATIPECVIDLMFNWNWMSKGAVQGRARDSTISVRPFSIPPSITSRKTNGQAEIKLLAAFSDTESGIAMALRSNSGLLAPSCIRVLGEAVQALATDFCRDSGTKAF